MKIAKKNEGLDDLKLSETKYKNETWLFFHIPPSHKHQFSGVTKGLTR